MDSQTLVDRILTAVYSIHVLKQFSKIGRQGYLINGVCEARNCFLKII